MVTARCVVVILLFETFSATLILTGLRLVYINNFFGLRWLEFLDIGMTFTCTRFWTYLSGM